MTSTPCWAKSNRATSAGCRRDSRGLQRAPLIGTPHPHKIDSQRVLERLVAARERLVTDAEVLQEILHRYVAIDRRDAIQPAFDLLLAIVDDVLPVDRAAVERGKSLCWAVITCRLAMPSTSR